MAFQPAIGDAWLMRETRVLVELRRRGVVNPIVFYTRRAESSARTVVKRAPQASLSEGAPVAGPADQPASPETAEATLDQPTRTNPPSAHSAIGQAQM